MSALPDLDPAPRLERLIRRLERAGNRLPHPFTLFVVLGLGILLLSAVLSELGVSAVVQASPKPGAPPVPTVVEVRNLLSGPFLQDFLTRFVSIYSDFPPLGLTMAMMLGIGVLEQSGFMSALMRRTLLGAPPFLVTALLAFVGINANLASGAGVIFTATVGAALFKSLGRNPWLGVAAGYAAGSGGFTANLLIAGTDVLLAGITDSAVRGAGLTAPVHPLMNWYFMVAATFVVTLTVTLVTERVLTRVLPDDPATATREELSRHALHADERRGLRWAGLAAAVCLGLVLLGAVPQEGVLRNELGNFLPESPLTEGSVAILFFFFFTVGTAYAYGARVIQSNREIPRLMEGGLRGILGFLVVVLPAAVFIHLFNESRLATLLSAYGASWLRDVQLGSIPLLILFIGVVALLNIFMTSGSAKWLVLAPVFVPMFAAVDLSPAATQLAYRVGDSATNVISPIKSSLPVMIGLLEQYRRQDDPRPVGIGTVIAMEFPYSLGLLVALVLLLVLWILFGLPLGPGAPVHLG